MHVVIVQCPAWTGRHFFSLVTGILLLYYPFGNGVVHLLLPSILTYLIMLRIREYAATLAWLVNFGYLISWYVMLLFNYWQLCLTHITKYVTEVLTHCSVAMSTQAVAMRGRKELWTTQVCFASLVPVMEENECLT